MGIPPSFSTNFLSKGDNFYDFLFAYLENKVFRKWRLLLKEKNLLPGEQIFSFKS